MAAELEPHSWVEAFLEEVPGNEPRCWVRVTPPGSKETDEIRYPDLMARPAVIDEDKAVKQKASRLQRNLIKEWKAKNAAKAALAFEIVRVVSDRSPYEKGFDVMKHFTIYYKLDGIEHQNPPSSLDRIVRASPEKFPTDTMAMIRKAVGEKLASLKTQCKPPEAAASAPEAKEVLEKNIQPAPSSVGNECGPEDHDTNGDSWMTSRTDAVIEPLSQKAPYLNIVNDGSMASTSIEPAKAEEAPTPAPASEEVPTAAPEASPSIEEDAPAELELTPSGPTKVSGTFHAPAVNNDLAMSESINHFLKMAKEQGEEAAITAKREEEAPRIEEHERTTKEEEEADLAALRDGSWWGVVNGAIDEFLAGEPDLRKAVIYSALSAGLKDNRIHLMAIGDSQMGKSYPLRSIGSRLFPGIFIDVASMSGKAMFYAAKEANDPRYYDGKIMLLDELADQSESTLDFMKAGMSPGAKKLTNLTVDEHRKGSSQELEGLPVFWSTSAEVLEDAEGQIMNRPFVVNPDETLDQTRKIMDFQRDAVSISLVRVIESKIPHAQRLLARILEEKDLTVYNLFAQHVRIKEDDARARNTLPMFFNLVAAVAYAHRFARPVIELPNGRKLLFASYQDNLEAAELWRWASGSKSTGLPMRHLELLNILPVFAGEITGGLDLDTIRELYCEKTGRKVSHKTVLNYLSQLSSKDKATYYESVDKDGKEVHLWYSTGSSHTIPTASQLLVGIESKDGDKLLDEALESLKSASSQLPNDIRIRVAGLREELLGKRSTTPVGRF